MTESQIDTLLDVLKYGGLAVGGISGILGTLTKTHTEKPKRKLTVWGKVSVFLTVVGLFVAATSQSVEGHRQRLQDEESRKEKKELKDANQQILTELKTEKAERAKDTLEFNEKFQQVLVQLDAAKHSDSKKITEEKIRVIQKDVSDWADNFVKDQPRLKAEFDKTKSDLEQGKLQSQIEEVKKEVQISGQAFPVISFAVRYVQEAVRAYAKKTGKEITIEAVDLPQNFYEKPASFEIRLSTNAVWKFSITARRPALEEGWASTPNLRITFTDRNGQGSGSLVLRIFLSQKHFSMTYQAPIPTPSPESIAGNQDLSDYETPIRIAFQRVIEAQLIQAFEQ